MHDLELLIALLGVAAAAVWVANRVGVPYPVFLVLAGLGLGAIPGLPEIEIDPDVIFLVFLPPLIHAAAWLTPHKQLRDNAGRVTMLAVGNVAVSMVLVTAVLKLTLPGVSWEAAFVLGAVLGPTDTVAATAVFRRLGVPERVVGLVEGESLLNDGVALVAYRLATAAVVSGTFSLLDAGMEFVVVSIGGAAVGMAIAVAVKAVRRHLDDPLIEITVTLLTPYLAWIGAEEAGASGVLAAAASGLYLGWRQAEDFSPRTRLQAYGFWGVLVFVLESVLFILIGLQFPSVVGALDEDTGTIVLTSVLVVLAVLVSRVGFVMAYGAGLTRARRTELSRGERLVVAWSGMRGAVSLAAALAIPLQTDAGGAFPARDLILFLTLVTIGATLTLQGLTLPWLIRRVRVAEEVSDERAKVLARFYTTEAALEWISGLDPAEDGVPPDLIERARSMYAERARQLSGICRSGVPERTTDLAAWAELRRKLVGVERETLIALRNEGRISAAAMREVERDLDLEQERLQRVVPAAEPAGVPA